MFSQTMPSGGARRRSRSAPLILVLLIPLGTTACAEWFGRSPTPSPAAPARTSSDSGYVLQQEGRTQGVEKGTRP